MDKKKLNGHCQYFDYYQDCQFFDDAATVAFLQHRYTKILNYIKINISLLI